MIDPLQRGLPTDAETERLVLGAILTDPEALPAIQEHLAAETFAIEDHRRIYRAMLAIAERGEVIDAITTSHELGAALSPMGGLSRILALDEGLPKIYGLQSYAAKLTRLARKREALSRLVRLYAAVESSDEETILPELDGLTEAISGPKDRHEWLSPEEIVDRIGGIEMLLRGPAQSGAIVPPWPRLAQLIPGFLPGQFIIVAARPGVGKTIALSQIMEAAVSQLRPARMVSLEMLAEDVITRMACSRAQVSLGRVMHGHADQAEKRAFSLALGEIYAMQFRIRDATKFTVPALAAGLRRQSGQIKCVLIDYIGLMEGPGRSPYERIMAITRELKQMALRERVCVIAAAQLNRQAASEGRPPDLHDLRDSGSIEQDADAVIVLHELKDEPFEGARRVDMIVRKHRRGPLGSVAMVRIGKYSRLEEM